MKKVIIITCSIIGVLVLVIGIGGYMTFKKELGIISTIKLINDTPKLYTMQYNGDYGFDDFLAQGGAASSDELAEYLTAYISKGFYKPKVIENSGGCSTIAVINANDERIFGRNFDWNDCTMMIVETNPPNGYRSISTVNLHFMGYSADNQPDSTFNSFLALGAPFVPLDGMNETGLCVADLVIDNAGKTQQDTGKSDITTTTAIRLLLDCASTIEEAVALLEQYDMHSDIDTMHHIAIADATGRSVVVEYIDNMMFVTETSVVTNFFLTEGEKFGFGSEYSKKRYNVLFDAYSKNDSIHEEYDVKNLLQEVRSTNGNEPGWITQWSVIFNQTTGAVTYYLQEDFEKKYEFTLKMNK